VKEQVVVLGFDGADPKLLAQLIGDCKLPNIQKLSRS